MGGAHLSDGIMPVTPKWIEFQDHQFWGYSSIQTISNQLKFQFIRDTDGAIYNYCMLQLYKYGKVLAIYYFIYPVAIAIYHVAIHYYFAGFVCASMWSLYLYLLEILL